MGYESTINKISKYLDANLPREIAWLKMSPQGRDLEIHEELAPRKSAVLIALYKKDGEYFFPLLRRPKYDGPHSGQMALPGGKVEKADKNIIATALREAYEEVGIEPDKVQILGILSELHITISNMIVTPVVGYLEEIPTFKTNEREVDELFQVPISFLFEKDRKKAEDWKLSGNLINVPFYDFHNQKVWGATAMILSEFEMVLNPLR